MTPTVINAETKLDDHGKYQALDRRDGESLVQFNDRLLRTCAGPRNATARGLAGSIAADLGLADFPLLAVTAASGARLEVLSTEIRVEVSGGAFAVPLLDVDADGFPASRLVSEVAASLSVSGLSAVPCSGAAGLPAFLLLQQSTVGYETQLVPAAGSYRLSSFALPGHERWEVVPGTASFDDPYAYATEVSGVPAAPGEWSVSADGNVLVFTTPQAAVRAGYARNALTSGATVVLGGCAAKVVGLDADDVQSFLYGPADAFRRSLVDDLAPRNGAAWGS
jgi:hypothetical protein